MNKDYLVDPGRLNTPETGIYVRARHGEEWGPHDVAHLDRDSVTRWLGSGNRNAEQTALLLLFGPEGDPPRTPSEEDRLFREIAASVAAEMTDSPNSDGQRYRQIPTIGGRCERWLGHAGDLYLVAADAPKFASERQGRGDNIPKLLPGDVLMRIAHAGDCYGVYAVFRGALGRLADEWRGYDGVGRFIGNVLESDRGMLTAVADMVAEHLNRDAEPTP